VIRQIVASLLFVVYTLLGIFSALGSRLYDRSGDTVLRLARIWSWLILSAAGVKLTVRFAQPLDPRRPYVFMPNHVSVLDIWALYVAVPIPLRMIAKKQLGDIPLFGWAMRAGRFIFIDRQNPVSARRSIDDGTRFIREGHSVLIFPEGTRTRDGKLGPFKKGGFYLAINSGAAIVPIAIRGARELMPRGQLRIKGGPVTVDIGAPISTDGLTEKDREPLLQRVRGIILEMTGEAPPSGGTDQGMA
jgi:1-acyl-sn-glycerol-3-phosphate acyltransferase